MAMRLDLRTSEELLKADLRSIWELTARDIDAWRALSADAIAPNPYFEPEFVLPAARAFLAPNLALLTVRSRDVWLAALPVRPVRSWRGLFGRLLAAWRTDYSYLGTPLVRGGDLEGVLAILIKGTLAYAPGLAIDWVQADGDIGQGLMTVYQSRARIVVVEEFERPALIHRGEGGYLDRAMSASHRSQYRRARRRMQDQVGPLLLRDDSRDPEAPYRFLDLERAGWKGDRGTRTAMACRPRHGEFFVSLCASLRQAGRLQLLSLANEERLAAMQCDLVAGETVFGFKSTYDEQLRRFSPGIQLHIANLSRFHDSGKRWIDSCAAPDNASVGRLWPDRRRLRSVVVTGREPSSFVVYSKWRAGLAASRLKRRG